MRKNLVGDSLRKQGRVGETIVDRLSAAIWQQTKRVQIPSVGFGLTFE